MGITNYKICSNCVMDTTDSKISFDKYGVCDHCNTFKNKILPYWKQDITGEQNLLKLIDKIKIAGKNHEFDCIVGLSGGVDSSYLTYIITDKFGLRPLVFHVDAGWNSQFAVNNIERLIDKLGLDLYTHVVDWEEMKDLQLAYFKSGVPHIDVPQDHAFFATMYDFAFKYNVKYILTGGNYSTECVRNPIEWMYFQSDSIQLKDIHKKFGNRPLNSYMVTNILWHKVYLPYFKGIRVVRPLDFILYNKEEAMKILVDKFGWQRYPQKHFESRFTKFYESYWLPVRFGFDTRRVQYSSLILTGQMTRDEAIQRLSEPAYDPETINQDFEYVANKLGISMTELESYLKAPKKTYKDYRSQESIYNLGAKIMRILRLEKGGKR